MLGNIAHSRSQVIFVSSKLQFELYWKGRAKFKLTWSLNKNESHLFENENVLLTMNKDNDGEWIEDWIEFILRFIKLTLC